MPLQPNYSFEAIGTQWVIETRKPLKKQVIEDVRKFIDDFDAVYSRFKDDSTVTRMAQKAGTYVFPNGADVIFSFYDELYAATDGRVTPLVGSLLEDMGYDSQYTFKQTAIRPVRSWGDDIERHAEDIVTKLPVVIDIGAAGKGYVIDQVGRVLKSYGYVDFVIDGSGDILHAGTIENIVGLEDPRNVNAVIGSVNVVDRALCASASNKRKWGEHAHHIVDPTEAMSVDEIIATWVVADSAMVADGIATALFFYHPKTLKLKYNYEYARMHKNGSIEYSDFFKAGLY
jgi:FAD:protein FMN transferase